MHVGVKLALALVLVAFALTSLAGAAYVPRTWDFEQSCLSSEPNVETGDVAFGHATAGNSNITDRDTATGKGYGVGNTVVIDLLSAYTITELDMFYSLTGGGASKISYSTDGVTYQQLIALGTNSPIDWLNQSIYPVKNVRFIRIDIASSAATVREFVIYGHPELCYRQAVRVFGDPTNFGMVYREVSYNNTQNDQTLLYEGLDRQKVLLSNSSAAAPPAVNIGVLPEFVDGHFVYVATGNNNVKVYKVDTVAHTSSLFSAFDYFGSSYALTRNATHLFVFASGDPTGSPVAYSVYALNFVNGGLSNRTLVNNTPAALALMGGGYVEDQVGGITNIFYGTEGTNIHRFRHTMISPANLVLNSTFSPAGTSVSGGVPYYNGSEWRVLFGSQQDGNWEIYDADGLDGSQVRALTDTTYNEIFNQSFLGFGNLSGNGFVVYLNSSNKKLVADVFCMSSVSPQLGVPCNCPSGYSFNGVQCIYTGANSTNQSYDRVELYVRDRCENNHGLNDQQGHVGYVYSCPNGQTYPSRDYLQLKYLINGQDAKNLTNGTAYCTGSAYASNFSFTYKQLTNASGALEFGFEKDVSYDLGNENASAFCPWWNSALFGGNTMCLRGTYVNVYCFANSSQFSGDDIETFFYVRGSEQNMLGWQTSTGTGGQYTGDVPVSSQQIDVRTRVTYDTRAGDLSCGMGWGRVGVDQFGGIKPMVNDRTPLVDTWRQDFSHAEGDSFSLQVGDNRFTQICLQADGVAPVQTKVEYSKVTAYDDCQSNNGTAWIQDAYYYATNSSGTFVLPVSYENTTFSTTDDPWFRLSYWVYDQYGQHQATDATCSYVVYNNTPSHEQVVQGILAPYETYYRNQIRGPNDGPAGRKVWPQSGNVDGKANYTIVATCTSSQCRNIPTFSLNFSILDSPCTGVSDSCYPVNASDPTQGCVNCHDSYSYFTCDDGQQVASNAYECQNLRCVPQIGLCQACQEGNHLNVGITGSLNRDVYPQLDPGIEYRINFFNRTPNNVIATAPLSPFCRVFVVPNGGPSLPDCTHFSLERAIPGFDFTLCGLEYPMTYDGASDQMVWQSPQGITLNPEESHTIYAACTGNFANSSACTFRTTFDTFRVGGAGRCPNSIVNVTDGGYTDDGECFANAQPWLCYLSDPRSFIQDAGNCGCPAGMTVNSTTNGCDGNQQITTGDVWRFFDWKVIGALALFVLLGGMSLVYAYVRKERAPRDLIP